MNKLVRMFSGIGVVALLGGCSDDGTETRPEGNDKKEVLSFDTCEGATLVANGDYCAVDCESLSLGMPCGKVQWRPVENCCVLTGEPGEDLVRTEGTAEYAAPDGDVAPDLSCFTQVPTKIASGTSPKAVTMKGQVRAFANGCDTSGVEISVFEVTRGADPATNGLPGKLVGSASTTKDTPAETVEEEDCSDGAVRRLYEIKNIPTNTELLVVTKGAAWTPLYTYNLFIWDGDPDLAGDVYTKHVRALDQGDFNLIPTLASGSAITPGRGAIGGEIHDCSNVRLRFAKVETSVVNRAMVYFNDSEDKPMPQNGREETGLTSVWSALDIAPGPVRVVGTGALGGQTVSLGYYDVRVFPDAVTSLTLKGLQPHQVR